MATLSRLMPRTAPFTGTITYLSLETEMAALFLGESRRGSSLASTRGIIAATCAPRPRSARRPSREVESSNVGDHLRHVEPVDACGIAADDLRLLGLGHPREDFGQDLARLRERGLAVRIVRAPHHIVHADHVAQADANRVLLEAQHDVAMKEVA